MLAPTVAIFIRFLRNIAQSKSKDDFVRVQNPVTHSPYFAAMFALRNAF